jgi:hypothetical protein
MVDTHIDDKEPITERFVYRIYYITSRKQYPTAYPGETHTATTTVPYPETFGSYAAAEAFITANPGVFWGNEPQIRRT